VLGEGAGALPGAESFEDGAGVRLEGIWGELGAGASGNSASSLGEGPEICCKNRRPYNTPKIMSGVVRRSHRQIQFYFTGRAITQFYLPFQAFQDSCLTSLAHYHPSCPLRERNG
jgi:hypothetical protein